MHRAANGYRITTISFRVWIEQRGHVGVMYAAATALVKFKCGHIGEKKIHMIPLGTSNYGLR